MKTNLPEAITTVQEAVVFLRELHNNGEAFHPEDDATDVVWNTPLYQHPGREECKQLNKLMADIYNLPGNDGSHSDPLAFDPCGYLLDIEKYQTYCRDNGLEDDSDVISHEDMHLFVMEHIEVDEEEVNENDLYEEVKADTPSVINKIVIQIKQGIVIGVHTTSESEIVIVDHDVIEPINGINVQDSIFKSGEASGIFLGDDFLEEQMSILNF